jgi:hypothetical protein
LPGSVAIAIVSVPDAAGAAARSGAATPSDDDTASIATAATATIVTPQSLRISKPPGRRLGTGQHRAILPVGAGGGHRALGQPARAPFVARDHRHPGQETLGVARTPKCWYRSPVGSE